MNDVAEHLKMLRAQVAKCERLREQSRSSIKKAVYDRALAHYRGLLAKVERTGERVTEEQ
jgi:hypothetical protein